MDLKKIGLFAGGGVVRNGRNQGTEQWKSLGITL